MHKPNRENALEAVGLFTGEWATWKAKKPNTSQLIQINHKHIFTTMKSFSIADRVDDSLYRCNIYYSIFASFHTHMNIWFCVKCFNHRASEIYWHIFQKKKSVLKNSRKRAKKWMKLMGNIDKIIHASSLDLHLKVYLCFYKAVYKSCSWPSEQRFIQ